MLTTTQGFRLFAKSVDLTKLLQKGDSSTVNKHVTKLQTINRTGTPGDEVISSARLMEQIEVVSRQMVRASVDHEHSTLGYFCEFHHKKPAYLGEEICIKTIVQTVRPDKITFEAKVTNPNTNEVIGYGIHKRKLFSLGE